MIESIARELVMLPWVVMMTCLAYTEQLISEALLTIGRPTPAQCAVRFLRFQAMLEAGTESRSQRFAGASTCAAMVPDATLCGIYFFALFLTVQRQVSTGTQALQVLADFTAAFLTASS